MIASEPVNTRPGVGSRGPGAHDRTLEGVLRARAINLPRLPMLPESAIAVLAQSRDPHTTAQELSRLIQHDHDLESHFSRIARHDLFGLHFESGALEPTLHRIGARTCENILLALSLEKLHAQVKPSLKRRSDALQRHSLMTACACRTLNQRLDLGFRGEEFAAGLCHDIGRLLFLLGAGAYAELADPVTFREGADVLRHEQRFLGADHCTLGAWFAHVNEIPEAIVEAIQHHHDPDSANHHRGLVGLVAMADDMVNFVQRDQRADEYNLRNNLGYRFLIETFDEEQQDMLTTQLPEILREIGLPNRA